MAHTLSINLSCWLWFRVRTEVKDGIWRVGEIKCRRFKSRRAKFSNRVMVVFVIIVIVVVIDCRRWRICILLFIVGCLLIPGDLIQGTIAIVSVFLCFVLPSLVLGDLVQQPDVLDGKAQDFVFAEKKKIRLRYMLLLFLTGAYSGYAEPEVSVTAWAGEAPTPRLGRPLMI